MGQTIGILGPGRLGRALSISLTALGLRVIERGRADPTPITGWLASCDILLLTVRDDQLEGAIEALSGYDLPGKTVMMCAGAVPLSVLAPLASRGAVIAKLHPLQAFTDRDGQPIPRGTPWAIEGPIEGLVRPWLRAWQGSLHVLGQADWDRYHLAAVFAANFLPLFIRTGQRILAPLAKDPADAAAWLEPLVRQSVHGALDANNPLPFSGPAVRGDLRVLEKQAALLDALEPGLAALYRQASSEIARERDRR